MSTTEKQLDEGVQKVLVQIIRAASDFGNNPEKAEEYIRRKVNAIYQCGKEMGRQSALDAIFNGSEDS